jgi:hypothetical protein
VWRSEPTRDNVKEALEDLLSGRPKIAVPETDVIGCLIGRDEPEAALTLPVPIEVAAERTVDEATTDRASRQPESIARFTEPTTEDVFRGSVNAVHLEAARPPSAAPLLLALVSMIGCWMVARRRIQPRTSLERSTRGSS